MKGLEILMKNAFIVPVTIPGTQWLNSVRYSGVGSDDIVCKSIPVWT